MKQEVIIGQSALLRYITAFAAAAAAAAAWKHYKRARAIGDADAERPWDSKLLLPQSGRDTQTKTDSEQTWGGQRSERDKHPWMLGRSRWQEAR